MIGDAEYTMLVQDMSEAADEFDGLCRRCEALAKALERLARAAQTVQETHLLTTPAMRAALSEAWTVLEADHD